MKSVTKIIIATMLLITMPSMAFAETTYAEAQANATEQSSDLFVGISGTELSAEQADAVEGEGLIMQIVAFVVVVLSTIRDIY